MQNVITFPGLGLTFHIDRIAFSIGSLNIYWYGIIIAVGFRPLPSIVGDLYETGIEVYEVGDGKKVVNIMNAINDAHEVARLF